MKNKKNIFNFLAAIFMVAFSLALGAKNVLAQGGSECDQSEFCTQIESEKDEGSYVAPGSVTSLVIKAGQEYFSFEPSPGQPLPQVIEDGCYRVSFSSSLGANFPNSVSWERYDTPSPECQNISHLQIWWEEKPTAVGLINFGSGEEKAPLSKEATAVLVVIVFLGFLQLLLWIWRRNQQLP